VQGEAAGVLFSRIVAGSNFKNVLMKTINIIVTLTTLDFV
jgi:hypothetical protein